MVTETLAKFGWQCAGRGVCRWVWHYTLCGILPDQLSALDEGLLSLTLLTLLTRLNGGVRGALAIVAAHPRWRTRMHVRWAVICIRYRVRRRHCWHRRHCLRQRVL